MTKTITVDQLLKRKPSMKYIIGREIQRQVTEPMLIVDSLKFKALTDIMQLKQIERLTIIEAEDRYLISVLEPIFNGRPSMFDMRRSFLKLMKQSLKSFYETNLMFIDDTELVIYK